MKMHKEIVFLASLLALTSCAQENGFTCLYVGSGINKLTGLPLVQIAFRYKETDWQASMLPTAIIDAQSGKAQGFAMNLDTKEEYRFADYSWEEEEQFPFALPNNNHLSDREREIFLKESATVFELPRTFFAEERSYYPIMVGFRFFNDQADYSAIDGETFRFASYASFSYPKTNYSFLFFQKNESGTLELCPDGIRYEFTLESGFFSYH